MSERIADALEGQLAGIRGAVEAFAGALRPVIEATGRMAEVVVDLRRRGILPPPPKPWRPRPPGVPPRRRPRRTNGTLRPITPQERARRARTKTSLNPIGRPGAGMPGIPPAKRGGAVLPHPA